MARSTLRRLAASLIRCAGRVVRSAYDVESEAASERRKVLAIRLRRSSDELRRQLRKELAP